MSVILDALRKLDREKSSRKRGSANIAAEVVSPDMTRTGRRISLYLITSTIAAVAAAAITYGFILEFGLLSKSSPPMNKNIPAPNQQVVRASTESPVTPKSSPPGSENPPAASQPVPPLSRGSANPSKVSPQPTVSRPPAAMKHTPASAPRAPVSHIQEEMISVPPKVQSPEEKKEHSEVKVPVETKSPTTPSSERRMTSEVPSKQAEIAPKKSTEPTPNVSVTHPASLKLSAIAWFEEPSMRFAMINGVMAKEGSLIDGIKVVEINPTSVRLLHDGQYFEISMSK